MSDLVAIAYPDEPTARRAYANVTKAAEQGLFELDDVLAIHYQDTGYMIPALSDWGPLPPTVLGSIAGGLIGLALLGPLLGIAGATLAGRAAYNKAAHGIPDQFVRELWQDLEPGSVAIVMLFSRLDSEKVIPLVHEPGRAIHTTLSPEIEARLNAALGATRQAS